MVKNTLHDAFKTFSEEILRKLLARKLRESELEMPSEALEALIRHILSGQMNDFVWDDGVGAEVKSVALEITEDDLKEVDSAISKAIEAVPEAVHLAVDTASELLFKSLTRRWDEEYQAQQYELDIVTGKQIGRAHV